MWLEDGIRSKYGIVVPFISEIILLWCILLGGMEMVLLMLCSDLCRRSSLENSLCLYQQNEQGMISVLQRKSLFYIL